MFASVLLALAARGSLAKPEPPEPAGFHVDTVYKRVWVNILKYLPLCVVVAARRPIHGGTVVGALLLRRRLRELQGGDHILTMFTRRVDGVARALVSL